MRAVPIITGLLLLSLLAPSFAESTVGIKAGYVYTRGIDDGALFGLSYYSSVDEAVELGFGFDVYNRTYSKMSDVALDEDAITSVQTEETLVDYSRSLVPLHFSLRIRYPSRYYKFGYFARGTFNYNLLFSKETNYETQTSEKRRFDGIGWLAGAGLFYRVGSKSTLIAEAFYSGGRVSRDIKTSKQSLPVSQRVDISGPGVRISVELDVR